MKVFIEEKRKDPERSHKTISFLFNRTDAYVPNI